MIDTDGGLLKAVVNDEHPGLELTEQCTNSAASRQHRLCL